MAGSATGSSFLEWGETEEESGTRQSLQVPSAEALAQTSCCWPRVSLGGANATDETARLCSPKAFKLRKEEDTSLSSSTARGRLERSEAEDAMMMEDGRDLLC